VSSDDQPRREWQAQADTGLRVRILGPVEFTGGATRSRLAPKQRAVLAVLAINADTLVSSTRLINALWDGTPPPTAAGSLMAHISRLRRAIGDIIVGESGGYRLVVGADDVDATRFERLTRDARAAREAGELARCLDALDVALGLWRGDPLADVPPTVELTAIATALRAARLDTEEARLDVGLALGRHEGLLPDIERASRRHPERERLWAMLMLALYRCGRQADALRAYQRARSYLVGEIGVEPGLELRAIERRILDHDPELLVIEADAASAGGSPAGGRAGRVDGFPTRSAAAFVGRSDERERLLDAWAAAAAGVGQVAWVTGEPGIGKTTLLVEFAHQVAAAGGWALYGACAEIPTGPYQPFLEALPFCVPDDGSELPPRLWPLAHLLPGLAARAPREASSGTPREPGVAQFKMFDAVADLLADATSAAPVLLVVDDLHWADTATLSLLRHLTRRLASSRLLIAAAARDTDDGVQATSQVIHDVSRATEVHRVPLTPLSEGEVRALLTGSLHDGAESSSPVTAVARATGGNPLLVKELARNLAEVFGPSGDIAVPDSVADLVLDRVHRLGNTSIAVLRVAALAGPVFDVQTVIDASREPADVVLDAVERAADAGIVRELGDDRWAFVHDLIRQAIVRTISTSRATRVHARLADSISTRHRDERAWAAALAQHCVAAAGQAPPKVARSAYQQAADHALAECAWEDARRWAELALAVGGDDDDASPARCETLLTAGRAAYALGQADEYRAIFRDAAIEARRLGLASQLALAALGFTGWNISIDQEPQEELDLLNAALAALPGDDDRLRPLVLGALISVLSVRASREELAALLDEAITRARRSNDPVVLSLVLADADNALGSIDDAEARFAIAEELEPLARALEDREHLAYALLARQTAQYELGEIDDAESVRDELEELFVSLGHAKITALLALGRLTRPQLEGRFDDFRPLWDAAFEAAAVSPLSGDHLAEAAAHLYLLWWLTGELADHVGEVEELVNEAPALRGFKSGLALARAEAGDVDGARRLVEQIVADGLPENLERGATLFTMTATLHRLGPDAPAIGWSDVLRPYSGKVAMLNGRLFIGAYDLQLGWALCNESRPSEAIAPLERALAFHQRIGAVPWAAITDAALAEARAALGGQTRRA
jgi:DNA-binding SARP family transcriptional activator